MDLRIEHRTRRTLGAAAAGVALLMAATGCSAGDSSGDPTSTPARSSAPAASAAASSASPSTAAASAMKSSPAAMSKPATAAAQAPALDTVKNKEHKIAVVATGASTAKGSDTLATKLVIADHGCFHAVNTKGAPTLLVFPQGTRVNSQGKPSVTVGGTTYRVGDRLDLTGQKITLDQEQAGQISPCRAHGDVFQVAAAK